MRLLGRVVRLQAQRSSLKAGDGPSRYYDPAPLCAVATLTLTDGGALGQPEAGDTILDVHHRDHPASKNHDGINGLSIGFTSHYIAMRDRFGPHLTDGIAGESILVETKQIVRLEELAGGIVLEGTNGEQLQLTDLVVAEPCVQFTRFALRRAPDAPGDDAQTEALQFLRDGMRGFYASYHGKPVVIRVGAHCLAPDDRAIEEKRSER